MSEDNSKKIYGSYKVSEYTHGKKYRVDESEVPAR